MAYIGGYFLLSEFVILQVVKREFEFETVSVHRESCLVW